MLKTANSSSTPTTNLLNMWLQCLTYVTHYGEWKLYVNDSQAVTCYLFKTNHNYLLLQKIKSITSVTLQRRTLHRHSILYCTCMSSSLRLMRLFVNKFSSLFFSASSLILVLNASLFSCVRRLISSFKLSTSCWSATDNWDIKSCQQSTPFQSVSPFRKRRHHKNKTIIPCLTTK